MTSYTIIYVVIIGKLKAGVVVSLVVESSSVVVMESLSQPPMRSVPAGLCQDT